MTYLSGRSPHTLAVVFSALVAFGINPADCQAGLPSRARQLNALAEQIAGIESIQRRITIEKERAYLWLEATPGEPLDKERFNTEARRILDQYREVATHCDYLDVKVTYAQLQPTEDQERLLWEVINVDPQEMIAAEGADLVKAINQVKQGAVWALLNHRLAPAMTKPREELNSRVQSETQTLVDQLSTSAEGMRCTPLVYWYHDVAVADRFERIENPVLDDPIVRHSEERAPVAGRSKELPTIEINIGTDETDPEFAEWTKPLGRVEFRGTAAPASPLPQRSKEWWPWGVGTIGLALVGAALLMGCRRGQV